MDRSIAKFKQSGVPDLTHQERVAFGERVQQAMAWEGESDLGLSKALRAAGVKPNSRSHIANVRKGVAGSQGRPWVEWVADHLRVRPDWLRHGEGDPRLPDLGERRLVKGARAIYDETESLLAHVPMAARMALQVLLARLAVERPNTFGVDGVADVTHEHLRGYLEARIPKAGGRRERLPSTGETVARWLNVAATLWLDEYGSQTHRAPPSAPDIPGLLGPSS